MAVTSDRDPTPTSAELFRAHGRPLFGAALRLTRRPEDAEDVVQEAFLAYHQAQLGLSTVEAGRWLHRVVVNRCLDRLRRQRRWRMVDWPVEGEEGGGEPEIRRAAGGDSIESVQSRPVDRLDLARAVETLPEASRVVFLLHDVEGLLHSEIAERLGISDGTSKSQLHRARQRLRRALAGDRREMTA